MKKFFFLLPLLISASTAFSEAPDSTKTKSNALTAEQIAKNDEKAKKQTLQDLKQAEMRKKRADLDKKFAKYSRDHITVDLLGTNWIYDPNSSQMNGMRTKWFSRGINIYFNWDFRFKGSRVSFAPGIGYGNTNIYSRSLLAADSAGTHFVPINYGSDTTARVNKVSFQYVDVPLELRIRTNPDKFGNCWKIAVGVKGGIRVDTHTKEKLIADGDTKVYVIRHYHDFNMYRFGPTIRFGYSFVNINAYYGVLNMFKPGLGPKANEFSLGLSFTAL